MWTVDVDEENDGRRISAIFGDKPIIGGIDHMLMIVGDHKMLSDRLLQALKSSQFVVSCPVYYKSILARI